jgi:hypothetical protein
MAYEVAVTADSLAEMGVVVRYSPISWRHQHPRTAAALILRASAEAGGADSVAAGEKLAIESLIARDLPDLRFLKDAECASCPARGRDAHAPPRSGAAASSDAS